MTVKRFTFMQDTLAKADVFDNNEFVCCTLSVWVEQLVDLLNELNDENIQLQKESYGNLDGLESYKALYYDVCEKYDNLEADFNDLRKENEQLKKELSDIGGQLLMLDNCDNWDYDRMKHTVREIAEIIGYNGTINPKR